MPDPPYVLLAISSTLCACASACVCARASRRRSDHAHAHGGGRRTLNTSGDTICISKNAAPQSSSIQDVMPISAMRSSSGSAATISS